MNASDVGLAMRAVDQDGHDLRGNHHKTAVRYDLFVQQSGEVLQSWDTALGRALKEQEKQQNDIGSGSGSSSI